MQASPPPITAVAGEVRSDTDPARKSPSRGPPATTTMNTPWRRPRIRSGVAAWSMVLRNTIDTVSAQPATARKIRPGHSCRDRPKAAMAAPQAATASRMARPCRRMRPSQPENSPPRTAPTAGAATSRPTVLASPANQRTATAGNSARGWASTIAARSEKKVIRRFGRVARKRSPSRTEARRGGPSPWSGRIAGSRHIAYSEPPNATTSTRYAAW